MDEASGTRDDTHGSNNLTDTNTVGSTTGKINLGADFERSNSEYLSITHAGQSGLAQTGDLSVAAWVSRESADANYVVLSKAHNSNSEGYTLIVLSDGSVQFVIGDGTDTSFGKTAVSQIPSDGTLKHIAATFTAAGPSDKVRIYVNGALVANATSDNSASSISTGTNPFSIGARVDSDSNVGNIYDGVIDEVGIWSRVLSADDISQIYNSGSGLAYTSPSASMSPSSSVSASTSLSPSASPSASPSSSLSPSFSPSGSPSVSLSPSASPSQSPSSSLSPSTSLSPSLSPSKSPSRSPSVSPSPSPPEWTNPTRSSTTWVNEDKSLA